ncbi:MAG: biotin synthase BioB [Actinomycetota bacterium]|nr:biotin synthase BioB [Actinomycetota bacterium]
MDPIASATATLFEEREPLTKQQGLALVALEDDRIPELVALAHRVRLEFAGPEVEVESILSVKTGGCPEDCHFCSQSGRFETSVIPEPFMPLEDILEAAKRSAETGATEFCIVLAVRGPDDHIMEKTLEAVDAIRESVGINVACSLGILTREQAKDLAAAGVHRYNHNLETARSFFTRIVTTHTWEERYETCQLVRELGMELCSGGIMGMGETWEQRVDFAEELRALEPHEVPINFLNPRPGTPLQGRAVLSPLDALRCIALFRLMMPSTVLRYAGGREVTLREMQATGLLAGINALIVGNYLTTLGRAPEEDLAMLADLGMPVKRLM